MKKIKYLFLVLVLVVSSLSSSSLALASGYSTGKAVIPYFYQSPDAKTSLLIANITDEPIDVTVTLYDNTGKIVTDDNNISGGFIVSDSAFTNYNEPTTDCTATFTLGAHGSGFFNVASGSSTSKYGYGIIKWDQASNALQGLVVSGACSTKRTKGEESVFAIPVNGGLPF